MPRDLGTYERNWKGMVDRTRGYSAAAHFSCDLPNIKFRERILPSGKDVERLAIAADGKRLTVSVSTKLVGSEKTAERITQQAAEDIWWGLQRELADNIGFMTRLVRESIGFAFTDGVGNGTVSLSEAVVARDLMTAELVLGIESQTLNTAARHRRPGPSHAFDLFRDAVAERDPVLQFKGLYNAVVAAAEIALKCDCQTCTDEFVLSIQPATKLTLCTPKERKARIRKGHAKDQRLADQSTVFTSLRNRLDHAHSADRLAQGGWVATTAEIRAAVGALRSIAVRSLAR